MPQFQCYHGTNRANAETIREKQEFQPSLGDEQWLGDGIYFFEDYKEALLWGKKVKKYSDTTIVQVLIVSDDDNILDLTHLEAQELLDDFIKSLESRINTYQNEEMRKQRKGGIGKIININYTNPAMRKG